MTTNHTLAERGERVEQVDREAAASIIVHGWIIQHGGTMPWMFAQRDEILAGCKDETEQVRAFAKHRIAARNAALDEMRACMSHFSVTAIGSKAPDRASLEGRLLISRYPDPPRYRADVEFKWQGSPPDFIRQLSTQPHTNGHKA